MEAPNSPFRGQAIGGSAATDGLADAAECRRALALLVDARHSVELRGLPSGRSRVCAGLDLDGLVAAAAELSDEKGTYYCLNPVSITPGDHRAARVADVVCRRWLLIDIDPQRPKDSNATDQEKEAAVLLAGAIVEALTGITWPAPIEIDSGNGWHLLYRIDMPADPPAQALLRHFLRVLAGRFDTASAKVDTAVHNASRVSKLPGTWSRKGPHSAERPHRPARLVSTPGDVVELTALQIEQAIRLWTADVSAAPVVLPLAAAQPKSPFRGVAEAGGDPGRARAYARSALEREAGRVLSAQPGERNNALNRAAFAVAQFLAAGHLGEGEIIAALTAAAAGCGLDGIEVERTIRSGLEAGRALPRELPPPRQGGAQAAGTAEVLVPEIAADDVATIDDLVRAGAEVCWLWEGWVQVGTLTVLAAEGGTGKTRFCADLLRRIRHGLPWPDGQPMYAPADSLALWVMSDNHHDEMVGLTEAFGVKDGVRLNASRADPYGGVTLDAPEELAALRARIRAVRPALVVIDTVGNATDRNLSRQEDAKAFYQPLQLIAREFRVALICVTHLNASGVVLGRRALEKVRVAIRMERPDPEGQPDRRRLEVIKSNARYPSVLGVTMGDGGNEYDSSPPCRAEEPGKKRGPAPARTQEAMDWLRTRLEGAAVRVSQVRDEAEKAGISAQTLYKAKDELGVHECVTQGKKWWSLTDE